MNITASTRLLVLLGDPVAHSLSPRIHNAAHEAAGLDAAYLVLRCREDALAGLMRGISRAGGAGNITVPHKTAAAAAVDRTTLEAARTGACNTFWAEGDELVGDNTDVAGFRAGARALLGRSVAGARVLLLGAGGAARAALCGLALDGAREVVLVNRSEDRATALAASPLAEPARLRVATNVAALHRERFDLAVNATSLGLREDDPLPLAPGTAPVVDAALDLVYGPNSTPWVRGLQSAGVPAADGREMLLAQAAAAFRRWWRQDPPEGVMREALEAQ